MEKGVEKRVLYVGIDDSNHAGDRKGDIIDAAFSFQHDDSIVRRFKKGGSSSEFFNWLRAPQANHDYRFTILLNDELRRIQPNIPLVAGFLIDNFLASLDFTPADLKLYIDGLLAAKQKAALREKYKSQFPGFVVDNFVKHMGIPNCPRIVYMAHLHSNILYQETFDRLTEDPKYVPVSENEILKNLEAA